MVDLLRNLGECFPLVFDQNRARRQRKHFPYPPPLHPHDVVHKVSLRTRFRPLDNDTQRKILRKRPKNNKKAWIKMSEAILNILRHCWENFICSSGSEQDWWRGSQPARCTFNLQPDLLGSFPADVQNSNSALQSGWGGVWWEIECGLRATFISSVGGGGKG